MIEIKKVKTEWRAVQFHGEEQVGEITDLLDWAGNNTVHNFTDEYYPYLTFPRKKSESGERDIVSVPDDGYVIASNRGKVKVLTEDEFAERFERKWQ